MVLNRTFAIDNKIELVHRKDVGINAILRFCNLVVACLIFSGFFRGELSDNPYMDWLTLVLGLALCLQTHIVLILEKRNPDPFVLLLTYVLIFFYALRIFTLLLYPVQSVFLRFTYGPSNSNYALLYILIANVFIYAGFYRVKLKGSAEIDTEGYSPKRPRLMVVLFILSLLFGLFVQKRIPDSIAHFISLIYDNFLQPNTIILVLAAYAITFRKQLPAIYMKVVLGGAIIMPVLQTLAFSRSGMLTFVESLFILILALVPTIRLPRKFVVAGFTLLPLFLVTAFTFYSISTATRLIKGDAGATLPEKVELFQQSRSILKDDPRTEFFIGQALSRTGFFDYSAELISNSNNYSGIFTVGNYMKSIVDNILTPGFDVFDQPKLSNSLKYAGSNAGPPSKNEEVNVEGTYNTDQFGLYGEMYCLFGYGSVIILFFLAYFIKKGFRYKGMFNPLEIVLNKILWLTIYLRLMNSFGVDWIISDICIMLVSFYSLSKLFRIQIDSRSNSSMSDMQITVIKS